eukprot:CAMPEP_0206004104 /NCGR_PEP_ID=MMETSP1464-20131121/3778_1 /ASSEMBLY_ACC=CAM_ASM_001124 /TAXON_ID=119497 /ORGANISM="Exanthemachrysis gayraliae, Strain RCC1523" /LENGTH=304 /DNA_ID=CAMNT_0053377505 /DNA_START=127 /DNA_END=1037 /DNA_ORIENTATION=+
MSLVCQTWIRAKAWAAPARRGLPSRAEHSVRALSRTPPARHVAVQAIHIVVLGSHRREVHVQRLKLQGQGVVHEGVHPGSRVRRGALGGRDARALHGSRLVHVERLLHGVELHEAAIPLLRIADALELRAVQPDHVADVAEPILQGRAVVDGLHGGLDPAALVVAADDDVRDLERAHRVLDDGHEVRVGADHHVSDVAVDEHLPGALPEELIRRHARVGAADPEVLWLVLPQLLQQAGGLAELLCPRAVLGQQPGERAAALLLADCSGHARAVDVPCRPLHHGEARVAREGHRGKRKGRPRHAA